MTDASAYLNELSARLADLGPFDRVSVEESDFLARVASSAVEVLPSWRRYALTLNANDPEDAGRGFASYDARFLLAIVQAWHVRQAKVDQLAELTDEERTQMESAVEAQRIEAQQQRERELRDQAAAAIGAEIDQAAARLAELEAQRAAVLDGTDVEV